MYGVDTLFTHSELLIASYWQPVACSFGPLQIALCEICKHFVVHFLTNNAFNCIDLSFFILCIQI